MSISQKIEAVLFWRAEPMSIKRLAASLDESEEKVREGLAELENLYAGRGIAIMRKDDEVVLSTSPDSAALIEKLSKDELSRDIGRAGLEALSIILYYGPISRRDIDYIRGVNSTFIVRHLLIRALVERVEDKKDQRIFLYKPTFDALSFLGIKKIEELPNYQNIRSEFDAFLAAKEKVDTEEKKMDAENEAGTKDADDNQ